MPTTIRNVLKYLWSGLVAAFLLWFFYDKKEMVFTALATTCWYDILWATLALIVAKLLLVLHFYSCMKVVGSPLPLVTCYAVYNRSQLYKYIPGNIWHFVSKASYLRDVGLAITAIRNVLFFENIMLLGSSFFVGCALLAVTNFDFLRFILDKYFALLMVTVVLLFLLGLFFLCSYGTKRLLSTALIRGKDVVCSFTALTLNWVGLGLSFHFLLLGIITPASIAAKIEIIGVYAIAYGLGYITPFASAGLGVREAVLAMALQNKVGWEQVILASLLSRVLFILVEVALLTPYRRTVVKVLLIDNDNSNSSP